MKQFSEIVDSPQFNHIIDMTIKYYTSPKSPIQKRGPWTYLIEHEVFNKEGMMKELALIASKNSKLSSTVRNFISDVITIAYNQTIKKLEEGEGV